MLDYPLVLRPSMELRVILPFRLGVEPVAWSAAKRREEYPRIAAHLNQVFRDITWKAVVFDDHHPAPAFLRERKGAVLHGATKASIESTGWLRRQLETGRHLVLQGEVEESVWYLDWGLGTVEVTASLEVQAHAGLTEFLSLGNALAEASARVITFYRDWQRCTTRLVETLRLAGHVTEEPARHPSARLDGFGVTLLMQKTRKPGLELSRPQMETLISAFTGRAAEGQMAIHWPGVLAVADGYGGLLVVVDAEAAETPAAISRVQWLWRLACVYWCDLWTISKDMPLRTSAYLAAPGVGRTELERARRDRLSVQVLLQESSPRSICGTPLDERVYGGVWEAWKGEQLVAEVKEHLDVLKQHFQDSVDLLSTRLQVRMNWILFVLNILTFCTVIATLITTYDIENKALPPDVRLLIIAVGTGGFALGAVAFLLLSHLVRR